MNIEHIAFQVSDPAAMADWYVEHLGCSIKRSAGEPSFVRFVMDGRGAAMVELYHNPSVELPDYRAMHPMVLHLAFVSESPVADRDRLVAAGATVEDAYVQTPAGDELVMLRDPWGLALQLVKRTDPMLPR